MFHTMPLDYSYIIKKHTTLEFTNNNIFNYVSADILRLIIYRIDQFKTLLSLALTCKKIFDIVNNIDYTKCVVWKINEDILDNSIHKTGTGYNCIDHLYPILKQNNILDEKYINNLKRINKLKTYYGIIKWNNTIFKSTSYILHGGQLVIYYEDNSYSKNHKVVLKCNLRNKYLFGNTRNPDDYILYGKFKYRHITPENYSKTKKNYKFIYKTFDYNGVPKDLKIK